MNFTKIKGDVVMMNTYYSLRSLKYRSTSQNRYLSLEFYVKRLVSDKLVNTLRVDDRSNIRLSKPSEIGALKMEMFIYSTFSFLSFFKREHNK